MFPNRLRILRNKIKLNQAQLAEKLDVSASTIGMYEQGRREPDLSFVQKIADFFDVSVDYLLGRTDDPQSKVIGKEELPKELVDIGIEYIEMIKEAKASDISPEDIKEIIQLFKKMKK